MEKIVAIIPTHNRNTLLLETINQLKNQNLTTVKLEIVVIIDENYKSAAKTENKIQLQFNDVHTILGDGNWWYTKSVNKGIEYAQSLSADFILTLNDDIIIDKEFVQTLFYAENQFKNKAIIGAISLTNEKAPRISFSGIKKFIPWRIKDINYIKKFTTIDSGNLSGTYDSALLYGRGILIPITVINKLGLYDEKFVQYGSETDFTLRAYKTGIPVKISYDSIVYEYKEETSKGALYNKPSFNEYFKSLFNNKSINSIYKTYLFYKKHGVKALLPFFLFYTLLTKVLLFFIKKYK